MSDAGRQAGRLRRPDGDQGRRAGGLRRPDGDQGRQAGGLRRPDGDQGRQQLDPEIASWIDVAPAPDIDFRDVDAVRAMSAAYMAETGGPAPRQRHPRVNLDRDAVRTIHGDVEVLVWSPVRANSPSPWVLAMHGGGFVVGSALGAERLAVPLAAEYGIVTVSVEYSLAPEARAPRAAEECWGVLRAVQRTGRVAGVQVNPDLVAVHGSSAGASLAAGLALRSRDEGVILQLQSLGCPALDHVSWATEDSSHSMWGYAPTWSRAATSAVWDHYLGPQANPSPYVVPALAGDVSGVAPAHLLLAQFDVLRDEGWEYAVRLRDAGIPVTVDAPPGTVHGFEGLLPDSAVSRRALAAQALALARSLRRVPPEG